MISTRTPLLALSVAAVIAISACGSGSSDSASTVPPVESPVTAAAPDTEPPASDAAPATTTTSTDTAATTTTAPAPSATEPEGSESDPSTVSDDATVDERIDDAVERLAEGYRRAEGIWAGYDPNEHPSVVPFKDASGKVAGALAVNHPKADELGDATAINTDGTPFATLHRLSNLTAEADSTLEGVVNFDFHADLAGVDSFVLNANAGPEGDSFFDSTSADWVGTFLHEMFHRYQDDAFEGDLGDQDINGYDYSAENLELAALENRALIKAVNSEGDERIEAARRFAALRLTRMERDGRVRLDNAQEMFEGTARWIEHAFARGSDSYTYGDDDFDRELSANVGDNGVKDDWGFGRFYASGAAIVETLHRLDVKDVDARIEQGASPAEILIAEMGITAADAAAIVADARTNYDPLGELRAQAEAAEAAAKAEGDPFAEDGASSGGGTDAASDDADLGGGNVITDEEIECLSENGFDIDGDEGVLSDELFEKCLA